MVDFKREKPTIRELERAPSKLSDDRTSVYTAFASATNTDIVNGDRVPVSMSIANISDTVIPVVIIKAKNAGGDMFVILNSIRLPFGAVLLLEPDILGAPYSYNIAVSALNGTPEVQVITNY